MADSELFVSSFYLIFHTKMQKNMSSASNPSARAVNEMFFCLREKGLLGSIIQKTIKQHLKKLYASIL